MLDVEVFVALEDIHVVVGVLDTVKQVVGIQQAQ